MGMASAVPIFEKNMSNIEDTIKPFSMSYVLKTTTRHMRKSIDISIRKTFERVKGFGSDPEKSTEAFRTLGMLHQMRAQLDEFQLQFKDEFGSK